MSRTVRQSSVLVLALASACSIDVAGLGDGDAATVDARMSVRGDAAGDRADGSTDTGRLSGDAMATVVEDARVDVGDPPGMDAGPTCVSAPEACNALDDDCDGSVDEMGCPCDVAEHADHVYLSCTSESRSFDAAQSFCAELGYHLAVIDDATENDAVRRSLRGDSWIGLQDRATEGDYVWVDGTTPGYLNWRPGDAPRGASQPTYDCVEMDASTGEWLDVACGGGRPFVCEAPLDR